MDSLMHFSVFFFFNDTATTEIYTLSLHDALPISGSPAPPRPSPRRPGRTGPPGAGSPAGRAPPARSEEHTSELQSQSNLVCRLLLEKKKKRGRFTRKLLAHGRTGTRLCSSLPSQR